MVLVIAGLGALAPLLARFTKHLPWRVTQDITPSGLVEGRGGNDVVIPWSAIADLRLADWMGHAAVFVTLRDPFALLASQPRTLADATLRRWLKSEAWTGAHIVIMAATSRGNFDDLVARVSSPA